ncbi:hypothetical protein D6C78_06949 [Aureobasidium pullulans]|uniref:Aminoglycoside phosphotransferase domain-containing protein n=1 Tax=Aureobasidium pullulans TaxID=5580 RepID=A0A4T0BQ41_AURPU|nr:hypothetical protein D6C78_06949 [Aureobasidium pullulans]
MAFRPQLTIVQDEEDYYPAYANAEQEEIETLGQKINYAALETHAMALRPGILCHAGPLRFDRQTKHEVMGGMNIHVNVEFQDGVTWLARIRRSNATSPPPVVRDYIILSELATLQFLENVNVPTPRLLGYALEADEGNSVGVGYMLIEKLPGNPLDWARATEDQKHRIIDQLADHAIELSKHPLDKIGSFNRPGDEHIGPIAREEFSNVTDGAIHALGPFTSMQGYYIGYLHNILDRILTRQLYTHHPLDAYLIHRFLLDLTERVWPVEGENEKIYLNHADDKGDHVLVDDDYTITGIVDWKWAFSAPCALSFNSPLVLLDLGGFYAGDPAISLAESYFAEALERKGGIELAESVRGGRKRRFFEFCCGYDMYTDWEGFKGLFEGLRRCVGVYGELEWEDWRGIALERYEEDEGVLRLMV